MKKCFCYLLIMVVLLSLCPAVMAQEAPAYQLGDKMEDFSVTLSDGTGVTLYGLLAQKKAVLINLWASWCGPCKHEFPFMQQVYNKYSNDVGILALSAEPNDTDEIILALREEIGITTIPVGLDTAKLANRIGLTAFPTSVLVDRNGVICLIRAGSVPDKESFERLFDVFVAEDYEQPVLLKNIPLDPGPAKRPAQELRAALGVTDERITVRNVEEEGVWPFYAAEDGSCVRASNDAQQRNTCSGFSATIIAASGQALAYDYFVTGNDYLDALWVYVDGKPANLHSGELDWHTGYIVFEAEGEHTVQFLYNRQRAVVGSEDGEACVARLRMTDAAQAAIRHSAQPVYPKPLEGKVIKAEVAKGELKQARVHDADGKVEQIIDVLQGGSLTYRLCIGKDVDPNLAFLHCDGVYHMLSHLPYDDEGFLLTKDSSEMLNFDLLPYHYFSSFANALDEKPSSENFVTWLSSEAEVDIYMSLLAKSYEQAKHTPVELSWEYVDGTPKQDKISSVNAVPSSEGVGRYTITVLDDVGAPVGGVMLQICDDATCAVAVTDDNGTATHEAAPYPYEIHVLKAPEGYAADTGTYTMPEGGGSLVITLQK